jgi:UDP-N-acetylmuramoyl-tripeptide--D-alanyl-D-alanine ligase
MIKKIIEKELGYLAKYIYQKFRPYVVGITGSSGKTTTKYFIGELLKSVKEDVLVAPGNMNTETGLPLAVIGFKKGPEGILEWVKTIIFAPFKAFFTFKYPKYLVLEYAADKPGDIEYLTKIIPPDIAVITNIGVAHLEAFGNLEKIICEKWYLALRSKQKVIVPREVLNMAKNLEKPQAEILIPGEGTVTAVNVKNYLNKTEFDLYIFGRKYHSKFQYLGKHNLDNLELAVLAVFEMVGEKDKIVERIPYLLPQEGRGKRIVGRRDILIIDESYNANPLSMLAALEVFSKIKYGRKVAILGEMKEIGRISEKSHQEIVKAASKIADFTIGVGEGFKATNLDKWYPNVGELEGQIEGLLQPNDVVLIKGSRANRLEKIVSKII